jgi:putative transposase
VENDVKIADIFNIMRTTKKRKVYKAEFKAKVALEAVKGRLTINQIAKEFEVHPNQVATWKKQFLDSLPQVFESSGKSKSVENEELTNRLYQQIGQMKVELDWLKKKSARLG